MDKLDHEHQFVLASTVYVQEVHRNRSDYFRINTFFCESCLAEKEIVKEARNQERVPDWFIAQGCQIRDRMERW